MKSTISSLIQTNNKIKELKEKLTLLEAEETKLVQLVEVELKNEHVKIQFNHKRRTIRGLCLTNSVHKVEFYNSDPYGVLDAWGEIHNVFNEHTTFQNAFKIMRKFVVLHQSCK